MQIFEKTLDDVKLVNIEKPKIHRKNCINVQLRMFFEQIRPIFFISVKILGLAQFETIIVPPCTIGEVNYRTSEEEIEEFPNAKI